MTPARHVCASALGGMLLISACGSELRVAPTRRHPVTGAAPIIVDFPPPPAQVELIPPDPGKPCVWVDGQWNYVARRWQWTEGSWVKAGADCAHAPPVMVWLPEGERGLLYYREGQWYRSDGTQCEQPVVCQSRSEPGKSAAAASSASPSPGK